MTIRSAARTRIGRELRRRGWAKVTDPMAGLHVAETLRRLDVDVVIDVGANEGQFARMLRESGYTGRIASFEPVKQSYEVLARSAEGDPQWSTHQLALGGEPGSLSINVTTGSDFSSFLTLNDRAQAAFVAGTQQKSAEEVKIDTLDNVWDFDSERVFLKVDTQGWDLQVLEGAEAHLRHVVGIQIEVVLLPLYEGAPMISDSLAALQRYGFGPTGLFPVAVDPDDLRIFEMDCIAVRTAK